MTTSRSASSVRRRSLLAAASVVLAGALTTWGALFALDHALAVDQPETQAVRSSAPAQP